MEIQFEKKHYLKYLTFLKPLSSTKLICLPACFSIDRFNVDITDLNFFLPLMIFEKVTGQASEETLTYFWEENHLIRILLREAYASTMTNAC